MAAYLRNRLGVTTVKRPHQSLELTQLHFSVIKTFKSYLTLGSGRRS